MKLEDQVCSLHLSKKLKDLGIKQESLFWWYSFSELPWELRYENEVALHNKVWLYSAFTVSELGELLPTHITVSVKHPEVWGCDEINAGLEYDDEGFPSYSYYEGNEFCPSYEKDTEANLRAKMLIWLIENNYWKMPT